MNEDTRTNNPSELEKQSIELNEEQLDEVTGGILTVRLSGFLTRRCTANPSHVYSSSKPNAVCPICGAKGYTDLGRG